MRKSGIARAFTMVAQHLLRRRVGAREAQMQERVGFGFFVAALSLVGMAVIAFALSGPFAAG